MARWKNKCRPKLQAVYNTIDYDLRVLACSTVRNPYSYGLVSSIGKKTSDLRWSKSSPTQPGDVQTLRDPAGQEKAERMSKDVAKPTTEGVVWLATVYRVGRMRREGVWQWILGVG